MQIQQLSTALPKNGYTTEEMLQDFPCPLPDGVKNNILNLGVSKRYLIDCFDSQAKQETLMDETPLIDLCSEACAKALEEAQLSPRDIGYFVAAYDVNPFFSPGLSQLLIRSVGFDPYIKQVNAQGIASTAFPKALELAWNHLATRPKDKVLVCVSGVSSYWFQNQVRGLDSVMEISKINQIRNKTKRECELRKWVATMQYFLFADGVTAAAVAKDNEGLTVKKIVEVTNVSKKDYMAGYARLSTFGEPFKFGFFSHLDKEIPTLGVKYTNLALKRLLGKNFDATVSSAKKWAVHTGSQKILNALAESNRIELEKLKESHDVLKECGNLAGASLPFILKRIVTNNKFSNGDVVLMVGYGWGFSASACLLEFEE
jgi:predicted naringenin-chalcone synthase